MEIIENKRKIKHIPKVHERKVGMELQQMEDSLTFGEYRTIPRMHWAKVHRLSGDCSAYHAVGITPSHRMIFSILGDRGQEKIKIKEYSFDYHKEKRAC